MKKIYGYYFAIMIEKGDLGYVGYAPGVGGVYEEGKTEKEAESNTYEAACAILETRLENNDPIVRSSKYIKVITKPPTFENIADTSKRISRGYLTTIGCSIPISAVA